MWQARAEVPTPKDSAKRRERVVWDGRPGYPFGPSGLLERVVGAGTAPAGASFVPRSPRNGSRQANTAPSKTLSAEETLYTNRARGGLGRRSRELVPQPATATCATMNHHGVRSFIRGGCQRRTGWPADGKGAACRLGWPWPSSWLPARRSARRHTPGRSYAATALLRCHPSASDLTGAAQPGLMVATLAAVASPSLSSAGMSTFVDLRMPMARAFVAEGARGSRTGPALPTATPRLPAAGHRQAA